MSNKADITITFHESNNVVMILDDLLRYTVDDLERNIEEVKKLSESLFEINVIEEQIH